MTKLATKIALFFMVILITVMVITACNRELDVLLPTPEIGKSALAGYLVNTKGTPLKNTIVRLAEVYRESENSEEGAYILDTSFSPGTVTNENGFFSFQNIEPIEYVIVVGDVENNNYQIIPQENGRPKVWRAIEGQILDVGKLRLDFSND